MDFTENMCDQTMEYWQLWINLCQFFNFLLHVTGQSYQFLRFNYLMLLLNFIEPTDIITLTLLKCCETVTSGEVNASKNFTILDGINKHVYIYQSAVGNNCQSQVFKGGVRKKWLSGRLKEFLPCLIFAWGLAMFLVKKRLSKIKYGFEFSISNVDLSLF